MDLNALSNVLLGIACIFNSFVLIDLNKKIKNLEKEVKENVSKIQS